MHLTEFKIAAHRFAMLAMTTTIWGNKNSPVAGDGAKHFVVVHLREGYGG
jgi:hypothetical protein